MIRAAVHVHSDWSYDGSWPLAGLAAELRRRGYGAVLMAEHDRGFDEARWRAYRVACLAASEEAGIPVVAGIEYSDADNAVHVPVWGEELPFLGEARPTGELIEAAVEAGGAAMLAHPERRAAWKRVDEGSLARLVGIEVWNRKYHGWAPGEVAGELCASLVGAVPFFGLDFHTRRQFFPLAMGIEAEAGASPADLVGALLERRCRPLAFGLDGRRFMRGPGFGATRAAERSRRALRPAVRRLRAARGRA